ncbi:MAG TPA: PHB depolymerase family esterase [Polyangiaceae bacterium]
MSTRLRLAAPALACFALLSLAPTPSFAQACDAGWKCNVNYGGSTLMDLYVPTKLAASPPILVALHFCGGTAASAHSWFKSYADTYGFTIIAPTAGGNCFDATPGRSGERAAIVSMVDYVVTQNKADTKRVFAAGASSGACMTQVLLASYPDVFAAGSSLAAVPVGAWTGGNAYGWSTPASTTAQQWGQKVTNADPGFNGTRPRVQLWQGQGDTTLTYSQNYPAEVAQWTNVFGVTAANATMTSVKPPGAKNTWARTSYKDGSGTVVLEANSGPSNVVHDLTPEGLFGDVIRFLGLDQTSSGGSGGAGGAGGAGAGGSSGSTSGGGAGMGTGGGSAGTGTGGIGTGGTGTGGIGTGGVSTGGVGSSGGPAGGSAGASSGVGGSGLAGSGTGGAYAGATSGGGTGNVSGASGSVSSAGTVSTGASAGDASESPELAADKPGCSCRVAGSSAADGWLGLLVAGALISGLRRRRAR